MRDKEMVDRAAEDGREAITVPATNIAAKLDTVQDVAGKPAASAPIATPLADWSASVEYRFIDEQGALTPAERAVFGRWREIAGVGQEVSRDE